MYHNGAEFTTKDRDNDQYSFANCAKAHTGGNWYKNCVLQGVNSRYNDGPASKNAPPHYFFWNSDRYRAVKSSKMMVRNC